MNALVLLAASAAAHPVSGQLLGSGGAPLEGAEVRCEPAGTTTRTSADGTWTLDIDPGTWTVLLSAEGFEPATFQLLVVDDPLALDPIRLWPLQPDILTVVVTPGSFSLDRGASTLSLSTEDLEGMSWSEDATRAAMRLPGVTGSDYSSRFAIRGGEADEVLLTLDGMQLAEPFHQRDYQGGLFSIVDPEALDRVDLVTGGFSAEHGNRLSGIYDMHTRSGFEERQSSVGLSVLYARGYTHVPFLDGRGEALVTARRTTLDLVYPLVGQVENLPSFYDGLAKVSYDLTPDQTLSLHALHASDDTHVDNGGIDAYQLAYKNTATWARLRSAWSPTLFTDTVASATVLSQDRVGGFQKYDHSDKGTFAVSDVRSYLGLGLQQDWSWIPSDSFLLGAGFEVHHEQARYDYHYDQSEVRIHADGTLYDYVGQRDTQLDPSGQRMGAYVQTRIGIRERVYLQPGVRLDFATYAPQPLVMPRVAAAVPVGARTTLRAAWGLYSQTPMLYQIDVSHGATAVDSPQRATHYVLGAEHHTDLGLEVRVEGYVKDYTAVNPRWHNLRDQWEVFPEARNDDVRAVLDRARAYGGEVLVKLDRGGKVTVWGNYALARAEEHVVDVEYDGLLDERTGWLPRSNNQTHTLNLDVTWRPTPKWRLGGAFTLYQGWVRTTYTYDVGHLDNGHVHFSPHHAAYQGTAYPVYYRLDLRVSRELDLGRTTLTPYVHVINVTNHKNLHKFDLDTSNPDGTPSLDADGAYVPVRDDVYWLGIVPVVGMDWTF
ncbi:MAG: TonB-dependent receptor [Alphaproteobacteria bacterium]|nr:TonB-dependent receptor [Alphaproteobacteria bacterium]